MIEKDAKLTKDEEHDLRAKVGQLLWLAHQSRPDLLFDVTCIAAKIANCTVSDIISVNKIIIKAKSSKMSLKFQNLGKNSDLVVFSDASLGNLPNGGSQGGYLILLVNNNSGEFSPIWWNSKKIRRVVRSTLAAETLAMTEGIDMAIFIATLFAEITYGKAKPQVMPITCVTDCKSLMDAVNSQNYVAEKRLRMEISGIKELLDSGQVRGLQWLDTKQQLADCLTKRGASSLGLRATLEAGII